MNREKKFLELLPQDGSPVSNQDLMQSLGLSKEEYFQLRDRLLEQGKVIKMRGRGGKTARAGVAEDADSPSKFHLNALAWVITVVALGALALMCAGGFFVSYGWILEEAWVSALTLIFGGVTVLSIAMALTIYGRQRSESIADSEAQARLLRKVGASAELSASNSEEMKMHIKEMMSDPVHAAEESNGIDEGGASDLIDDSDLPTDMDAEVSAKNGTNAGGGIRHLRS